MAASTNLTPEQRTKRARKAAEARHSTDTLIRQLVDRAPELTESQKALLAPIFVGEQA